MTDTTLNYYLCRGTNADRLTFTPNPGTPAAGPDLGVLFFTYDTVALYAWDGAAWQAIAGSVTSVAVSGGTTGLTTSGGPITSSGTITIAGTLAIANGGTGQTSAANAINALLPTQTGHSGEFLTTNGSAPSWAGAGTGTVTSVAVTSSDITVGGSPVTTSGTITLALPATGATAGSFGSATKASTFTVNASGVLTASGEATVTPAVGSITGFGTGVATFLATPSSANLASAVTDETGSGLLVFATSPTLTTPNVGYAVGDGYKLSSSGIVTETGTTRTLSATDNGVVLYFTNGSGITLSMASGLGAGFSCVVLQGGAGQVTFSANSQTMTVAGGLTKTAYVGAMATIIAAAANTFFISGTLA